MPKNPAVAVADDIYELIDRAIDSVYLMDHEISEFASNNEIDIRKVTDADIMSHLLPKLENLVKAHLEGARNDAEEFEE